MILAYIVGVITGLLFILLWIVFDERIESRRRDAHIKRMEPYREATRQASKRLGESIAELRRK